MSAKLSHKEFQKLKREWDKKLEKSGFYDIEQPDGKLKHWDSGNHTAVRRIDPVRAAAKQQYFQMAGKFLYAYSFDCSRERAVWELHSNGCSLREIRGMLRKVKVRISVDTIRAIIKRLSTIMLEESVINVRQERPSDN